MTAAWLLKSSAPSGLQPVDLSRHLGGIAELIELCFSHELDAGARGLIREMRWLSRTGPALRVLQVGLMGQQPWNLGFVWVEAGRVVGTVSTQPATGRRETWIVANVAVHPDFRRRGLADQLMRATLDLIGRQGGVRAILQVDDNNLGAVTLYRRLGFGRVTTQTTWMRPAHLAPPPFQPAPFDVRQRGPGEWRAHLALASLVRPEGLAWGHPLAAGDLRPGLARSLEQVLTARFEQHWVAFDPAPAGAASPRLAGALTVQANTGDGDRLVLLVHPGFRGQLELPLLAHGLRRRGRRPLPVRVEHSADDEAASQALAHLGFQPRRSLRWMQYDLAASRQRGSD